MFRMSMKIEEKIKIERMFSIYEGIFPHNYIYSGESHNFWECVYVVKGSIRVSADSRVYNLNEGEIIVHKPMEFHKFVVDGAKGAKLWTFSFAGSGDVCEKMNSLVCRIDEYQKSIFVSLFSYIKEENRKFCLIHGEEEDIYIRFFRLLKNPIVAQIVSAYITQIILSVSQQSIELIPSTEHDAEIFRKAVENLKDNLEKSISVSHLADVLCISESTLRRIFKKYTDVSVHRYFLMLKIQKATQMLSSGMSVFEVSERLNFSSQAYFSACYKRETGKNPSTI